MCSPYFRVRACVCVLGGWGGGRRVDWERRLVGKGWRGPEETGLCQVPPQTVCRVRAGGQPGPRIGTQVSLALGLRKMRFAPFLIHAAEITPPTLRRVVPLPSEGSDIGNGGQFSSLPGTLCASMNGCGRHHLIVVITFCQGCH